jgi:hypothetical protein
MTKSITALLIAGLAAGALLLAACSSGSSSTTTPTSAPGAATAVPTENNPPGDIPDNQVFVTYQSSAGAYSLDTPEGWARTESGSNVKLTDKLHSLAVDVTNATSAPTVDSVATNELPTLTTQIEAFEKESVESVDLTSGKAVRVRYLANSAPDSVTGKQVRLEVDRYEIFKGGKLAVLSLSATAGSDNVDVWNRISSSFAWR